MSDQITYAYAGDIDKSYDEDGELIPTPIGVWSEVKKRIIIKKDN